MKLLGKQKQLVVIISTWKKSFCNRYYENHNRLVLVENVILAKLISHLVNARADDCEMKSNVQ